MLTFLIVVIVLTGLVLAAKGVKESWPLSGGVTSPAEMLRLRELNDRINRDMERTLTYGKSCFRTFGVLANTKYRSYPESFIAVIRDRDWQRVRKLVMSSAKKGKRHCQELINLSPEEPDVIVPERLSLTAWNAAKTARCYSAEKGG